MPENDFDLDIQSTFFTEITGITQSSTQAFGPVGTTTAEKEAKFQVTSQFTPTGSKKAFAVCKSRVFIQPHATDNTKVNLILHPFKQPSNRLQIKYFVYRGLDKSEFIHSSNTSGGDMQLIPNANLSTANDLVKEIWAKFKAFNDLPSNTTEPLLAKWIGYDPANQLDTALIDSYLYKISTDDLDDTTNVAKSFELPTIDEGAWIGTFSGEFGLDIVLDYGDYDYAATGFAFTLAYARAAKWQFDIAQKPNGIPEKAFRQPVLHFVDPAAFWGMHYSSKGKIITKNNAGTPADKIVPYIYDDVVDLFATKNNLYLAIQSDRGQSYNYYGNYNESDTSSNAIKLGVVTAMLTAQTFGTDKWPLIISNITQTHSNARNNIFIQLVTDNNQQAVLYCQNGSLETENTNKFLTFDQLFENVESVYTKEIQISLPATGTTDKYNVAGLVRLIYNGKVRFVPEYVTSGDPQLYPVNYLDDVFSLVHNKPFEMGSGLYIEKIPSNQIRLVDLSTVYPQNKGFAAMQMQAVFDYINESGDPNVAPQKRVLFETSTLDFKVQNNITSLKLAKEHLTETSEYYQYDDNNFYLPKLPYDINVSSFTVNPDTINGIQMQIFSEDLPSKFVLGISYTEYANLIDLVDTNNLFFVSLYLNKSDFEDFYFSSEYIKFQKFELNVIADKNGLDEHVFKPSSNILLYTLDNFFFFSKEYSSQIFPLRLKSVHPAN